jgi:hypothetical protein
VERRGRRGGERERHRKRKGEKREIYLLSLVLLAVFFVPSFLSLSLSLFLHPFFKPPPLLLFSF